MSESLPYERGLTLRSLLVLLIVFSLTMVWVLRTELMTGSYATGGTPPAIAVGWLLLLLALSVTIGRFVRALRLSRAELLVIYACLALGVPMASYGIMRAFLPHLTVLSYYAEPSNRFSDYERMLPAWQLLRDGPAGSAQEIIRQCFEGAPNERVPWAYWVPVLARWFLFFAGIFLCLLGTLCFFRKRWVDGDRLQFPILYLPTELLPGRGHHGLSLLRHPLFYLGVGLAFLFNLSNVLKAFNPALPALGTVTDLNPLFTEAPLNALRPIAWNHMPQVVGLGYLVNLEVLFSTWLFFLGNKALAVLARTAGYTDGAMPYMSEQCSGAYPMVALILTFMARREIGAIVSRAFSGRRSAEDAAEPLPAWGAALACFGGLAFLAGWCNLAGMNGWLALIFLATVLSYSLVYARIRAEVGVPYSQIYPIDYPLRNLRIFLGSKGLQAFGPERNLALLASLSWLSYHYYSHFMAAYQMDGLRLADHAQVRRREMALALGLAMAIGFAGAAWAHLSAYYQYGQNVVDGGTGVGDWRSTVARQAFEAMQSLVANKTPPDTTRMAWTGLGAGVALGLAVLRFLFLRFPLHPMGFLIATSYGNECPIWGDLLLVWIIKSLVLRLGGVRLYRQLIPIFLGLAIGQFFWGGLVWGNITPFIPHEIALRYWLPRV